MSINSVFEEVESYVEEFTGEQAEAFHRMTVSDPYSESGEAWQFAIDAAEIGHESEALLRRAQTFLSKAAAVDVSDITKARAVAYAYALAQIAEQVAEQVEVPGPKLRASVLSENFGDSEDDYDDDITMNWDRYSSDWDDDDDNIVTGQGYRDESVGNQQLYRVPVKHNYNRGGSTYDYTGRDLPFPVLASSAEEAREIVIKNRDEIEQLLRSRRSRSGRLMIMKSDKYAFNDRDVLTPRVSTDRWLKPEAARVLTQDGVEVMDIQSLLNASESS